MTSFQSTLGDEEEGIADELAESQRQISIAEFFEKNKHMLGFDSGARGLVTAVKEGVDNALDACEEAEIKPDVYVEITEVGEYYKLVIEDNGPGITKEQAPKVFGKLLYGSRFHKREQSLTPDQRILIERDGGVESVPIGRLCDAYLPGDGAGTARIPDDVRAPSFDRETHEMSWQDVTHAIRHETDAATYEITTQTGRTTEVTGDHSVFTVDGDGETREVAASELTAGDTILAPRRLPETEREVTEINLLDHLTAETLADRELYVHGFDSDDVPDNVRSDEVEQGCLPAETVKRLGWEDRASDRRLQSCRTGGVSTSREAGDPVEVPVTVPVGEALMELLGSYLGAGHGDDRQGCSSLRAHEAELLETVETGATALGTEATAAETETTAVERDRDSTRGESFESPLALFVADICRSAAGDSCVPQFVFDVAPAHRETFLRALHEGDGSDGRQSSELSHTTRSETVARQLSALWSSLGVVASSETTTSSESGGEDTELHRIVVDSADVVLDGHPERRTETGRRADERASTRVSESAGVHESSPRTVPESDLCLLEVTDVTETEPPEYVYDISVPGVNGDDENFVVANEGAVCVKNSRGQQGIGISAAVLYSQLTSGKPAKITSRPKGQSEAQYFELIIDTDTNEPEISVDETTTWDRPHGTRIELEMEANMRARSQLHDYISQTAVVNPHARIELREPGLEEPLKFERAPDQLSGGDIMPDETEEIKPHPHGVELGTLIKMLDATESYSISGFLQGEFTRVGKKSAESIIDGFRDRYYGRELGWSALATHVQTAGSVSANGGVAAGDTAASRGEAAGETVDLERAIHDAVANKSAAVTDDFAARVAETLESRERTTHSQLVEIVDTVGDDIAAEYDTTFGDTVRANAVDAAWATLTRFDDDVDLLTPDLYTVVDEATTRQKDDAVVAGVAERLARRIAGGRTDTANERADGERAGGDRADGEQADGERADGERADGERADRERADGERADGDSGSDASDDAGRDDSDSRHRYTREQVRSFVDSAAADTEEYDDATFGDTARENVTEALWSRMETVPDDPPQVRDVAHDRDTASDLLEAMRAADVIAPPTNCLAPITEELVEAGLRKEFDADFYAAATRDAEVTGGDPFIVEAGIAYGGEIDDGGQVDVLRFANRVPLVYQRGACATTDVVKQIGWRNYGLDQPGGSGVPKGPAVIMVHVASTNVPFTSESKDAVANVPEIEDEIELAIREAARDLKSFLNERRSLRKRRQKQDVLGRILPEMAEKVAEVTGRDHPEIDGALARIMNNVAVELERDGSDVTLTARNHTDTTESLEVNAFLSAEPGTEPESATVVEVGGEWVLTWRPEIPSGETATTEFTLPTGAIIELEEDHIDGVPDEKLTVGA
jgi:DNA topoisomerase-6 subunit B